MSPLSGLGSEFIAAASTGVWKSKSDAIEAASAFAEKNQKALARFGVSVAKRATATSPSRKN